MKIFLSSNRRLIISASQYATALILSGLILCFVLNLWRAHLSMPLYYSGDTLFYTVFVKGMIDNGWYWQNPFIGAPGGLLMYEFPTYDNQVAVFIWLISVFTHKAILVLNIFYLLTFPLITITSLYVFRHFNFSYIPSLFCSLLYAFLPYHFLHHENHIILSAYYLIPLVVMVLLWITTEELSFRKRKFIFSLAICLVIGSSGVYYPFFTCLLLPVAGVIGALKLQKIKPLAISLILAGIVCATVAVNLSPSLLYKYRHDDVGVMLRNPGEAETYGLKVSQLLLPITGHRVPLLNRLKRYHNSYTWFTESDAASLGVIGGIGFLALLLQLLHRKDIVTGIKPPGIFHDLSVLNIFAVLLGVVGGFGFLFSLIVSTGIRCYTRISIFIAFFSLMAVGIGLERIYQSTAKHRSIFYFLMALALAGGILDQTTPAYVPDHAVTKAEYLSDDDFVNRIEASVPSGAMIFQLPYVQFPENGDFYHMVDYDHFRGYVHSKSLRWSYGAIKNREGDRAQQLIAALPIEEFVRTLAFDGFSGIYLDRRGYEDGGASKESELSTLLQTNPLISRNGRLVFFNLTDYSSRLRQKYSDSQWQEKQELSTHPVLADWAKGFSPLETAAGNTWRWSSGEGELLLNNPSTRLRKISLEMLFATGHEQMDDLIISGLVSDQLKINAHPQFYEKVIMLPPGRAVVRFKCTAKPVDEPRDPRVLVFSIQNFKLTELE